MQQHAHLAGVPPNFIVTTRTWAPEVALGSKEVLRFCSAQPVDVHLDIGGAVMPFCAAGLNQATQQFWTEAAKEFLVYKVSPGDFKKPAERLSKDAFWQAK